MSAKPTFIQPIGKYKLMLLGFSIFILFISVFIYSYLIQSPKSIKQGLGASFPGDVNGDGMVDIIDFQLLSNSFGKSLGMSGFNANADFNSDNTIDILDFQVLSNNFGKTESVSNTPTVRLTTGTPTPRATLTPTPKPNITLGPTPTSIPIPTLSANPTYVVDKDNTGGKGCNDSWPGTLSQPFCTITKALSVSQPGNTISIRSGTYPSFAISKSGNSNAYLAIARYGNEHVTISGGSSAIILSGVSFVRILGLEIKGANGSYGAGVLIGPILLS